MLTSPDTIATFYLIAMPQNIENASTKCSSFAVKYPPTEVDVGLPSPCTVLPPPPPSPVSLSIRDITPSTVSSGSLIAMHMNELHWFVGNSAYVLAICSIFLAVELPSAELKGKFVDVMLIIYIAVHVIVHLILTFQHCKVNLPKIIRIKEIVL